MSVLPKRSYLVSDLVSSETRFDGSTVSYGYDARANLASVAYPDDTLRFTWDGDGLQTSAANAAGTVTNVHDAASNAGGSGKAFLGGGVEVSVPLDGNSRGIGISISGGIGAGGEGHVTISHTVVE